ncbi:MAG: Ap4A phosphorylase [Labilithrix sp.]|nr:Ap4A phosphorylase [Labilithrix sp.]
MSMEWHPAGLADHVRAVSSRALAAGALVPLALETQVVLEDGVPFEVLHAPALAQKALRTALSSGAKAAVPFDPFEPFEPAMFVADVETGQEAAGGGTSHVIVLNKFPSMREHVVLITRRDAPQLEPPTNADLVALAQLLHAAPGLAFYNGGPLAGASQEHKHFQLVPRDRPWPIEGLLAGGPARGVVRGLAYRHAFVRHAFVEARSPDHGADLLGRALRDAAALIDLDLEAPRLAPVNLLLTRTWLMLVPRTHEHGLPAADDRPADLSLNALGFMGVVLARSAASIPLLVERGIMRTLADVTR